MGEAKRQDEILMEVSHTIMHREHQKVVMEVAEFKKDKANFREHYSQTAVVVAANQQTGQVQLEAVTTCLCIWEDTISNYKTFQNKLRLMSGQGLQ